MIIYSIKKDLISLYTAVFYAYGIKDAYITAQNNYQRTFDDTFIELKPENDKYLRVRDRIFKTDKRTDNYIRYVFRCEQPETEQVIFKFIRATIKSGRGLVEHLGVSEAIEMDYLAKKVSMDKMHLNGFLRFIETADGVFYAPISPDTDILDLLVPHFINRYALQPFIIHDVKRKKACLYNTKTFITVPLDDQVSVVYSDAEAQVQGLWINYYNSVNIEERKNVRQMKQYMPVRYWRFLVEKNQNAEWLNENERLNGESATLLQPAADNSDLTSEKKCDKCATGDDTDA